MSPHRTLVAASLAITPLFAGCLGSDASEAPEATAEHEADISYATYYTARQDLRRCAYPLCGGIYVSAVNRDRTVCADGTVAEECYVADIKFSSLLQLAEVEGTIREAIGERRESTRAVLFGDLSPGQSGLGTLTLRFAWVALETAELRGEFHRVWHNGVVCVAAPCPSFDQEYLNDGIPRTIHEVELKEVPGIGRDDFDSGRALFSSLGMILAGQNVVIENYGPAGDATVLQATQGFLPVIMPSMRRVRPPVDDGPILGRRPAGGGEGGSGGILNTNVE
ncbi:DUF6748 domain-containing protein [Polyangium mundeleinium]|uniref:DUF6748 domain-containing protein n=1 Tax=Polyangium mundeleinium TaxID=2995306 RepID=A0ABT5EKE8_9BACT|nr:DUF6748 domain-containing protein [Polyangium mundeleinium]MDC0741417.1 hypothetical protein [Polyangium mundeleinium]